MEPKELIVAYLKGDPNALVAYGKMCRSLIAFKEIDEVTKNSLLNQLFEMGEFLGENTTDLVRQITNIPWWSIPKPLIPSYQRLLLDTALHYSPHIEIVFQACASNFRPVIGKEYTDEELDLQFKLAHSLIVQILRCVPMSANLLFKIITKFPHHSVDTKLYAWHFRNVILVGECAPQLRFKIWESLIQQLLTLDAYLSRKKEHNQEDNDEEPNIFDLEEEMNDQTLSNTPSRQTETLDACMLAVYQYITRKMGHPVEDAQWLRAGEDVDVLELLAEPFDLHLLMSSDTHVVPFIWLYACSLNPRYPSQFFEALWHRAVFPQRAQSDAKRSQNAASFLAAFLARATYVDTDETFEWLRRICDWLIAYIDSQNGVSNASPAAGASKHGTFYALCQAFFIIFCFRYKRIVANPQKWDQIRGWNLSRIVNSHLEPLKFVTRPVALCFATITRSLQLVYCAHHLAVPHWDNASKQPFEPSFPLDSYSLTGTSALITPLMRRFAPLAEDLPILKQEFAQDKAKKEAYLTNEIGEFGDSSSLAFLDEAEEPMILGSPMNVSGFPISMESSGRVPHQFTSYYSTSPGLKVFDYGQTMNINKISGMR